MTDLRTAAQQALEALEYAQQDRECPSTTRQAIAALRAALAQEQDAELSAALGWPGGISNPVLDRTQLLQMVAALRVSAQQARQALEGWDNYGKWVWPESALEQAKRNTTEALAALRAALAQEWAEPLNLLDRAVQRRLAAQWGYVPAEQAEQAQEPVAWVECDGELVWNNREAAIGRNLYTAPPRCPNCASLEAQNTELDRKLAKMEQAEPVQEPAFHGFMSDDGTQVDVCFSPSAPRRDGTYATAYYTAPPQQVAQQAEPLNLRDPAVQKRLAAQWGYVPAQAEPVQEHEDWCASVTQLLLSYPPQKAPCNCKPAQKFKPTPLTQEQMDAPPRRTMVPLTEGDLGKLYADWYKTPAAGLAHFARAIEKASWEKNNGQA